MRDQTLYILVEGDDDERFFESIIKPIYVHSYGEIRFWKYSQRKKGEVNRFLESVKNLQAAGLANYIFVADLDDCVCVMTKKERIASEYKHVTKNRMLIVGKMIEGWYLAGLDNDTCERIGIGSLPSRTDHLTKSQFNCLLPEGFDSRIECMQEILRSYDLKVACARNYSFRYFKRKCKIDEEWR